LQMQVRPRRGWARERVLMAPVLLPERGQAPELWLVVSVRLRG